MTAMTSQLGEPALEAAGLCGDLRVLRDVTVRVWPGKLSVLLGSNGAGKTTTLRAVSGLNQATAGAITLFGQDVTKLGPAERVGLGLAYVMEGKRSFHRRTVEENLLLGGYGKVRGRRNLRRQADRMYERFPVLGERRRSRAGELSGGQQQMLAIAQALVAEPRILLLDEPSGGLAPIIVNQVPGIVGELKAVGIGVLLVEQAAEEAVRIADHVAVLDVGRVVIDELAGQIADVSGIQHAYLAGTGPAGSSALPGHRSRRPRRRASKGRSVRVTKHQTHQVRQIAGTEGQGWRRSAGACPWGWSTLCSPSGTTSCAWPAGRPVSLTEGCS
jgi:branched-chain amino acid transport system ATP-binding protein